ncbi:acetyl-CoA carboxylase, biotin carboxyl carrier protein [Oscillochloris trichoides DG-6]|uniref:Biotin carboxyl carrier protein of acetyl-CoA carboxylase n=1 Tax=Oscillochloris trichoides DG-6 TaxID=765420 RepID=E1IH47_9CHLR|nr:acetyl-CoA carboxylase biotin carboxyl carrier protein [Oscillochloris trichoides]EFO79522.1 acetyl-CoA carboxylase, biotin carboxyl carrier protein [Oscillochloris trichoides DG-6]
MINATNTESSENADDFGLSAVRELLRLMNQTDITEILIERGDTKLHVKRGTTVQIAAVPHAPVAQTLAPTVAAMAPHPMPMPVAAAPAPAEVAVPAGHTITAPMVGTFYASPSPKDAPFVQEGDSIQVGDSVGIIEAMKMMNEIESDVAGRIIRILVTNGQPVEYGQPLMVVEPV